MKARTETLCCGTRIQEGKSETEHGTMQLAWHDILHDTPLLSPAVKQLQEAVTSHQGHVGLIRRPGSSAAKMEGIAKGFSSICQRSGMEDYPWDVWVSRLGSLLPCVLVADANMDIIGLSSGMARSGPGRKRNAVNRQSDVFYGLLGLLTTPGFAERLLEVLQGLGGGA